MEKRLRKLSQGIEFQDPVHIHARHAEPDLLIVGINSTRGVIQEGMERLEENGVKVNHLHIRQLLPFPTDQVKPLVDRAKKVVVVENNATGQLANLIKLHVGMGEKISHILKYDGNPFLPSEIYNQCKEMLVHGHV